MKVKIEMSKKERNMIIVVLIAAMIMIYFLNKRYLYIYDAVFENDKPKEIILKTGFIFPVKSQILMEDKFTKRIRLYGNKIDVIKVSDNQYDMYMNKKKIHSIYNNAYYEETKKQPVGKISL